MESRSTETHQQALLDLFSHHVWANLRLIDACASLRNEQLDATAQGAFGTIIETLIHIAAADESYLARLTGSRFPDALTRDGRPSLAELRRHAERSGQGYLDLIPQLAATGPVRVTWDNNTVWHVPPGIILAQAINHATEHRAQIMTIFTQLGLKAPDASGWEYMVTMLPSEPD